MKRNLILLLFFSLIFSYNCSASKSSIPIESPRIIQTAPSISKIQEEENKAEQARKEREKVEQARKQEEAQAEAKRKQLEAEIRESQIKKDLFINKMRTSRELDIKETLSGEALKLMDEVITSDPLIETWGTFDNSLILKLEKAIELDPFYHAAYYFLGMSYRRDEKDTLNKSLMYFQKAIELKPNYPEAYIQIAYSYQNAEMNRDAILNFKRGIEKGAANPCYPHNNIGILYWKEGLISEAENSFALSVSLCKDFNYPYYYLGLISVKQRKFKDALEYFQKLTFMYISDDLYTESLLLFDMPLENNPNKYEIYVSLGLIHYYKENYKEAVSMLENAKLANALRFSNHLQLGISYYHIYKYSEAKSHLLIAKAFHPNYFSVHYYLGLACKSDWLAIDYDNALLELYKAVEINPKHLMALYHLADVYYEKDDLNSSLFYINKALSINPKHAQALSKKAEIYHKKKDHFEAIKYFTNSLDIKESYSAFYGLAKVYSDMERYDTAIEYFKKLNHFMDSDIFDSEIAKMHFKKKEYSEGINILRNYLVKHPENNSARFSLASGLTSVGQKEEAKQLYIIIVDKNPNNFAAQYNLALIYSTEDNIESLKKAKELFSIASSEYPEDAKREIDDCEYRINAKQYLNKIGLLTKSREDKGFIASILLAVREYGEGNNLFIKGTNNTKPNYDKSSYYTEKFIISYDVSPLIFEGQGLFKKLLNEISELKKEFPKYQNITEKFIKAAESRIEGIETYSKGFYLPQKDYRGEFEKGLALIKLGDRYILDVLHEISILMERFPNNFNKYDTRIVSNIIKYYENRQNKKTE